MIYLNNLKSFAKNCKTFYSKYSLELILAIAFLKHLYESLNQYIDGSIDLTNLLVRTSLSIVIFVALLFIRFYFVKLITFLLNKFFEIKAIDQLFCNISDLITSYKENKEKRKAKEELEKIAKESKNIIILEGYSSTRPR